MSENFDIHNRTKRPNDSDEVDPVEEMIKKTGCLEEHYAVQFCMADHKDWRKCQDKVKVFQNCIQSYNKITLKK
ncbi:UNVERIFIED_CONTAM: hypothetical protein RMT77_005450 [Armadillidium vulgare]